MKNRGHKIKSFVMASGERYCLLVNKTSQLPLHYPNLYVTTQIRNNSLSVSAMETALSSINVLLTFCDEHNIDLEARFLRNEFFTLNELDAIRDYCQLHFAKNRIPQQNSSILISQRPKQKTRQLVGVANEYMRLTHIGKYSKWLAEILLSASMNRQTMLEIAMMQKRLESRRPIKKGRNQGIKLKGLSKEQVVILLKTIHPNSESNPFDDPAIRARNRLIILLLLHLGIRAGELLNIRISDIDWSNNQIIIARRPDEKYDPRADQPLVKTLDRRLPMKDTLAKEIHRYIVECRKKVPGIRKNDYLLVTHKPGPTQGQPLSRSAYLKVINTIAMVEPDLIDLHGHELRHTWNNQFSEQMDQLDAPPSPEMQEKMRSYLQGWKEGSGTSAIYTKRFTKAKAMEASLKLQEGISRVPENLKNE